jgi:large conductance mechanosensitive channel
MWQEFKTFIARGSVVDLAVGIIIGAAFTSVVNSLVNDILMPPIGFMTGGMDFSELVISLGDSGATINYGLFINAVINFLIVAFAMFLVVRLFNRLMEARREEVEAPDTAPAAPTTDEKLLESLNRLNAILEKMDRS